MARSKAQRDQDRADLLAVLDDQTEALPTHRVALEVYGGDVTEAWRHEAQVVADLNALARAGEVIKRFYGFHINGNIWERATAEKLDVLEDRDDIERQLRSWEPA